MQLSYYIVHANLMSTQLGFRSLVFVLLLVQVLSPSFAGYTAAQLFGQGSTYTYDDVIFLPGYIDFGAHEVLLASSP